MDGYEAAVAERDRLAAENAELRKWKADLEANVAAASKIGMDFGEMEFDAWFPGARPKTRKELTNELAAANATLDALREAVPEGYIKAMHMDIDEYARTLQSILYPQPAASIRDIADRHGFAPMPADLGQQNVNDHTTTAALAEEKTNGN